MATCWKAAHAAPEWTLARRFPTTRVYLQQPPYGMAVEVFSATALAQAHAEATQDAEREHVTPFIYWHPQRYRLRNVASPVALSHHRWTVDTPEDYELVRRLFDHLLPTNPHFTQADVLALLDAHPDWIAINQHVQQKPATETQTSKENP